MYLHLACFSHPARTFDIVPEKRGERFDLQESRDRETGSRTGRHGSSVAASPGRFAIAEITAAIQQIPYRAVNFASSQR
jgi:hypothetical protein